MLKDLGMRIVAEGVEIREQFEFLQEIGCDYIQGYLFCHPMPLSKILKLSKLDEKTMQEEYGMCGFERVWQDQEYYDKISSINLMHPSMISIGNDLYDLGYEFPVMIMEYKNDTFRYLRTGTGFINFLKDIQVSSLEQAEQYINDAEHPISVNMRELLNGREGSDEWLPLDFISGHNHCIGKAKVIALNVNTGAVALFCVVMNLSKYTRIIRSDMLYEMLHSHLDLNKETFDRLGNEG